MSVRLRRLAADQRRVTEVFADHPLIRLLESQGEPAESYTFEFSVTGLIEGPDGPSEQGTHRAQVILMRDYPRRPPFCRMLTPVYHPNIDPQKICIGDHWSAGQSLVDLVARIGQMICFQSYNTRSPLNAAAAAWAEQNLPRLPLDRADLMSGI